MRIGFIFPNRDRRYKTIHLGLAYLAAYSRKLHKNLSFTVLDTRVATAKETRMFFSSSFDLIGITVFSPVYYEVIEVFHRVKRSFSGVPVCLGGPYVTTIMEDIFIKTPADYAVYGEGEITFSELIDHLEGRREITDIRGLMFRGLDGTVQTNPPRSHIQNMDDIPFPAWDIFPMDRYPLHRIVTSRGCPFSCAWCNSSSIWNWTYRVRSPENVVEEIELLLKNYGKKIIVFGDNSFNIHLGRVDRFCDILIRKGIRILWSASIRADMMTQELAYKMKESGCYNASIGIESANNEILAQMNKCTTIEKITEGVRMMKKAGIEVMSQYVIGSPFETLDNVKESIEYARNSECDYSNFYTVLPFRGTPQWDYVEKYGTFYTREIHDFHRIEPRIVFETHEFPYNERLEAIRLAIKYGFYSNKDIKSWWFDMAKGTSLKIQKMLPESTGEKIFLLLKSIYKLRFVKKNNI
ncbi:MAG: B12-binding domain-containing radical SAM protein [Bacteroidales bacterium]|nr:B12-binding domain-containing radical SAM protein [Bacteroidales bacterium]